MVLKKIAVLTTGGDAPGMNAAIRGVVRTAINNKLQVMGILRGWRGLINEELKILEHHSVSGILNLGGTVLKTMRCPDFCNEDSQRRALAVVKKHEIDALVVIGGNGSFTAANAFSKKYGIPCVGIAASIDNDINGIDATIGLDTALNTALYAIDNIRDTATSMERVFVVEVMGRDCGFIALQVALAGGCEDVIIPERKFNLEETCHEIVNGNLRGKVSWIIVAAEGAASSVDIAGRITEITTLETRAVVLGHVQRGGRPTATSRILAVTFAETAIAALLNNEYGVAIGLNYGKITKVPFEVAIQKKSIDTEGLYRLIKTVT